MAIATQKIRTFLWFDTQAEAAAMRTRIDIAALERAAGGR